MDYTISTVFDIIQERKRFLRELSCTEIDQNEHPYLYTVIMMELLNEHGFRQFGRDELAPIIRVARRGSFLPFGSFIQNGRFVTCVYVHHVYLFVSVDIKEFVEFLLLSKRAVHLHDFIEVLQYFTLGLYTKLLNQNIRVIKKDFLLERCFTNEEIRIGVAYAISRYLELKTKKILRLKKPNSIINKYYGR